MWSVQILIILSGKFIQSNVYQILPESTEFYRRYDEKHFGLLFMRRDVFCFRINTTEHFGLRCYLISARLSCNRLWEYFCENKLQSIMIDMYIPHLGNACKFNKNFNAGHWADKLAMQMASCRSCDDRGHGLVQTTLDATNDEWTGTDQSMWRVGCQSSVSCRS